MMKYLLLFISFFLTLSLSAQTKSCDGKEEDSLEDMNLVTKCSFDTKKSKGKNDQLIVKVSVNKKHYLKRYKKSSIAPKVSSKRTINLSNSLKLKKRLLNSLSADEVKKAKTFITVDEVPAFKKCKATTGKKRKDCFNKEMISHINNHFTYPGEAIRKNIQDKIWVRFIIDSQGRPTNVMVKALNNVDGGDVLIEEAERIISELPFFIPGEIKGKPVSVKYGFPIDFSLIEG